MRIMAMAGIVGGLVRQSTAFVAMLCRRGIVVGVLTGAVVRGRIGLFCGGGRLGGRGGGNRVDCRGLVCGEGGAWVRHGGYL
ncbi:MAG: hypothetical protein EBT37_09185 [Betaproteobacteria bacterium]|nr:hypothetical protein [Betaproteobacteria bacterium]